MHGLGRLFALPWLLISLTVLALAPAEAAVMRSDPSGMGICSAHELGGGRHSPSPTKDQDHDCCALACALASVAMVPPVDAAPVRITLVTPAEIAVARRCGSASPSPLDRPRARGPPASILTT